MLTTRAVTRSPGDSLHRSRSQTTFRSTISRSPISSHIARIRGAPETTGFGRTSEKRRSGWSLMPTTLPKSGSGVQSPEIRQNCLRIPGFETKKFISLLFLTCEICDVISAIQNLRY
ncbi:MAG: hypothetical protein D084_Lepto4C00289G0001 [Leptospirillum sp. Group IV 'UBA BS']|nr:MAG: hypothetical protein D084_Lepto4C00289G0001 [Leptospirillum sp. Group IV 'UBA BS']